ncbi:MAG: hypothetical protein M3Q56_10800 [Bacteroidota bacterium]|nr:hypothetical protein [Bacteroidota bacterium]
MEYYKSKGYDIVCTKLTARSLTCSWADGTGSVNCDGGQCGLLISQNEVCVTCNRNGTYTQGDGACKPWY